MDARKEIRNVKALRDSLSSHKHILPYLATVSIGEDLTILSELATMDLQNFLNGEGKSTVKYDMADLICQARNLAGALAFLHSGLQLPGRVATFYHMDLNPDNILVFHAENDHVGIWKISDFGISTVKDNSLQPKCPESDSDELNTIGELVRRIKVTNGVTAKRGPGAYQAPEVHSDGERHIGTKSDIWSFGCIFVQILAFAIGGPFLVRDLDSKRGKMQDGKTTYADDYFYRDGEINPHIRDWLIGLPNDEQVAEVILTNCQILAFDMLEILPEERPGAHEVYQQLTRYDQQPKPSYNKLGARGLSLNYEARNQFFRTSQYEHHKERNPARVKETCQWFLQHSRYFLWRDSLTSCILWVSADPGCGKSVLARSLVDIELKASHTRTTCYFFFKDDNDEQRTASNALCALLHQIFSQKPRLLRHAIGHIQNNGDDLKKNIQLLWEILITASADQPPGRLSAFWMRLMNA